MSDTSDINERVAKQIWERLYCEGWDDCDDGVEIDMGITKVWMRQMASEVIKMTLDHDREMRRAHRLAKDAKLAKGNA